MESKNEKKENYERNKICNESEDGREMMVQLREGIKVEEE